ncbi:M48 family metallopeptidase [Parabacteroides sp. FAFU027]|uniref:M48 family metallopeptidase n=1 Tax=Parabacteroides sp. FAFU027 TaxID=2922715 RepID=UPI001FAFB219|nr:M48 family metallopeptidase [Parabacteroides sp. FAFU027]
MNNIQVSPEFRQSAYRSILSIGLFAVTYITLISLAIILTLLFGAAGLYLIWLKPMVVTIMGGIGLISAGILILIFLLKFIFQRNKTDYSNLIEIKPKQEPALFKLISEVVNEVQTQSPRKVYLTPEVNAAVFYSSSFWSMFLPVRKNLMIGVGLINTTTIGEFKGILAHEFGHFSQRSMKVGSYVNNTNRVIYNMLFENESYVDMAEMWASHSQYFAPFVSLALWIIKGIQWVLRKVYRILNLNYLKLSREMEFHADEVAANVVGSKTFSSALLRLEPSDQSLNSAINYFCNRPGTPARPVNIFRVHQTLLDSLAKQNRIPNRHGLPHITTQNLNRFRQSKLHIKNNWDTHPNMYDRVKAISKLNIPQLQPDNKQANSLLSDTNAVQERVSEVLFNGIELEWSPSPIGMQEFEQEFIQQEKKFEFDAIFHGFYDHFNPADFEIIPTERPASEKTFNELFSDDSIDLAIDIVSLTNDIETLQHISQNQQDITSFDYDGVTFKTADSISLSDKLKKEVEEKNSKLNHLLSEIHEYFSSLAELQGETTCFKEKYEALILRNKEYHEKMDYYTQVRNATQFMSQTTPFRVIEENLEKFKPIEKTFKEQIDLLLNSSTHEAIITDEIRANLTKYLNKSWSYFEVNQYSDDALDLLINSSNQYVYILSQSVFRAKKDLLDFQAQLEKQHKKIALPDYICN